MKSVPGAIATGFRLRSKSAYRKSSCSVLEKTPQKRRIRRPCTNRPKENLNMEVQSNIQHPAIAAVVAIAFIAVLGFAAYYFWYLEPQNRARVESDLFGPYFTELSEGHIDEAWQKYTTDKYKEKFPLEIYRAHWQQIFSRNGRIIKRSADTATDSYGFRPDDSAVAVGYELTFEKGAVHPFYYVVKGSDGTERINLAGVEGTSAAYRSRLDPQPW